MIDTKMFNILKKSFFFVTNCRICFGVNPNTVHVPSIILIPIVPNQLNCGFAGLISCRLQNKFSKTNVDRTLTDLWEKIKKAGIQSFFPEKNLAGFFLNGSQTIKDMERVIDELKEEETQEYLFFQTEKANNLYIINEEIKTFLADEEKLLEDQASVIQSTDLELINSRLLSLKDICWILEKDILANLKKILMLTGKQEYSDVDPATFRKYKKLNLLLNALDRLEVRGRDSAGIQLSFFLKNEKSLQNIMRQITKNGLSDDYQRRTQKGDLLNQSIFVSRNQKNDDGNISVTFTYKTFSVVGELGRNVNELRHVIQNDPILQFFAAEESVCETTLMHTRWASVGSITEKNCHPVNNYTTIPSTSAYPLYPGTDAQINVVLNGDIDNYPALRQSLEIQNELIAPDVATDTKIIPLQIEKYLMAGKNLTDAFRLALNDFEGSHAIAMTSNLEPGKMFLALKGSGQAIYVGISADQYLFSSELYGLVEVMPLFIKMNGEENNGKSNGQIFVLDKNAGSGLDGIKASFYDGTSIVLSNHDIQTAEITTRDIDRSHYPHYFLKEISESSMSIKKTLRGKYRITASDQSTPQAIFNIGNDIVPASVLNALQNGLIKKIVVIGHGTAAVAGQAVSDALSKYLNGTGINIFSCIASEFSGFGLKDNLSDTLVIPITQSGTTTDTNRAVAMSKERGAQIISIVNRRQSDITAKSHGVFYTSDGRDIEMSVASTKAFYAQIIAGQLLALYFAKLLGTRTDNEIATDLRNLELSPCLMDRIFANREAIAASVKNTVNKRYWAIVGSGPNKAAADEIRIKLSELCYKSISSDIVENKKHIDLSAEPLILVCASGNPQPVMEDVIKDVAIFKAHKAIVVVFADEDDHRFDQIADSVIPIPVAPSSLSVILNTMAGHLWGYYAALIINNEAQIFREFRSRLASEFSKRERRNLSAFDMIADVSLRRIINDFYALFNSYRLNGSFCLLNSKTIVNLSLLLKYASGKLPLQDMRMDFALKENLVNPFDALDTTLGMAIDELARPIDAIRHQAKTVTVGTSRKEQEPKGVIFDILKDHNFSIMNLTYREILTIKRLQPAVASVKGYTLYDIRGLDEKGNPSDFSTIAVRKKGGVTVHMNSRADYSTTLMGVKKTIVGTGHVYIGRGKIDNASIVIIPLQREEAKISNLLLIHIIFNEKLNLSKKIEVLGHRYDDIRNIINEYNITWNDQFLETISLESLFSEPIEDIAKLIKSNKNKKNA